MQIKSNPEQPREFCRVADPTSTPLNVRTAPDGTIVGTLNNGLRVTVLDHSSRGGREWAYVGRSEDRVPIGWVFKNYLDCRADAEAPSQPNVAPPSPPKSVDR